MLVLCQSQDGSRGHLRLIMLAARTGMTGVFAGAGGVVSFTCVRGRAMVVMAARSRLSRVVPVQQLTLFFPIAWPLGIHSHRRQLSTVPSPACRVTECSGGSSLKQDVIKLWAELS